MSTPFLFIAGHPALDFLNTEKANDAGERVELFSAPEDIVAWLREAGMTLVPSGKISLADARTLRDAIRALVTAWITDIVAPEKPLALLNQVLATGASRRLLAADFAERSETVTVAVHPLLPVAEAVRDLLTRQDKTLVRQCAGTGCVLWFLDTTKNKRRRWCRMEVCGNREKVSAHYHRHRKHTDAV